LEIIDGYGFAGWDTKICRTMLWSMKACSVRTDVPAKRLSFY
jgi:hypothetical protein